MVAQRHARPAEHADLAQAHRAAAVDALVAASRRDAAVRASLRRMYRAFEHAVYRVIVDAWPHAAPREARRAPAAEGAAVNHALTYWHADPAPAAPPLASGAEADIAIVGGGLAGLAAAARLLEADRTLAVTVLEARRPGFGASGRNAGIVEAPLVGSRAAA